MLSICGGLCGDTLCTMEFEGVSDRGVKEIRIHNAISKFQIKYNLCLQRGSKRPLSLLERLIGDWSLSTWSRISRQGLRVSHGHQHVVEDVRVALKCINVAATRAGHPSPANGSPLSPSMF